MSDEDELVFLPHARREDQRDVMEQIIEDGVCPFCPEYLKNYHKRPILREGTYWILTENQWPYKFTTQHLLAITKEHIEKLDELPSEGYGELMELLEWAIKERNIPGGGISIRFGPYEKSGATVRHLHAQLVEPDIDHPDYEPVRIKVGRSKSRQ